MKSGNESSTMRLFWQKNLEFTLTTQTNFTKRKVHHLNSLNDLNHIITCRILISTTTITILRKTTMEFFKNKQSTYLLASMITLQTKYLKKKILKRTSSTIKKNKRKWLSKRFQWTLIRCLIFLKIIWIDRICSTERIHPMEMVKLILKI